MGVIIGPRGVNHKRLQDLGAQGVSGHIKGALITVFESFATANIRSIIFRGAKLFFDVHRK